MKIDFDEHQSLPSKNALLAVHSKLIKSREGITVLHNPFDIRNFDYRCKSKRVAFQFLLLFLVHVVANMTLIWRATKHSSFRYYLTANPMPI